MHILGIRDKNPAAHSLSLSDLCHNDLNTEDYHPRVQNKAGGINFYDGNLTNLMYGNSNKCNKIIKCKQRGKNHNAREATKTIYML
jgi:hypothetical protein